MFSKLEHLTDEEQKQFYRKFQEELLEIFAFDSYSSEETLQNDFAEWRADLNDYRKCLNDILEEIAPDGIEMTWRDITNLTASRWKLCKVCNRPFLTRDKKNKMLYCYSSDYKRYKRGKETNEGYKEGSYFKATEKGLSSCLMVSEANRKRNASKENLEYIVGFNEETTS